MHELRSCVQKHTESYLEYYSRILRKYDELIQYINIHINDPTFQQFKIIEAKRILLNTFMAGIKERYHSYLFNFDFVSLEQCLQKCEKLDNKTQAKTIADMLRGNFQKSPPRQSNIAQKLYATPTFSQPGNTQFKQYLPAKQGFFLEI